MKNWGESVCAKVPTKRLKIKNEFLIEQLRREKKVFNMAELNQESENLDFNPDSATRCVALIKLYNFSGP